MAPTIMVHGCNGKKEVIFLELLTTKMEKYLSQKVLTGCELKKSFPDKSWMSSKSWDGGDSSVASSIASMGHGREGWGSVGNGSLGSQVLSSGSSHAGLVHWDHGTVGVRHEAIERGCGDGRETTNNNLERRENHLV